MLQTTPPRFRLHPEKGISPDIHAHGKFLPAEAVEQRQWDPHADLASFTNEIPFGIAPENSGGNGKEAVGTENGPERRPQAARLQNERYILVPDAADDDP